MSMEVNSNRAANDLEQFITRQIPERVEKDRESEMGRAAKKASDEVPVLQDEYISSEKSGVRPSGLYRLGQDEDGNPKVLFDDPKKSNSANAGDEVKGKPVRPESSEEKCTVNTDKVDREIEKLKEKKQQLEQKIRAASGDEAGEWKKELTQVENELRQKDNDAYRRQNSIKSGTVEML